MICDDHTKLIAERELDRFFLAKEFGVLPTELAKIPEKDLRKWSTILRAFYESKGGGSGNKMFR
jgi:hypothetical protein